MKIKLSSIFVHDQNAALQFYTDVLGFIKKTDLPMGTSRWLTVVAPDDPNGPELVLEPNTRRAAKEYQSANFSDGIPATAFSVENLQQAYNRLFARGVRFHTPPTRDAEGSSIAVFDDTCGNLIQIYAA